MSKQEILLDGSWRCELDAEDVGVAGGWGHETTPFKQAVTLPGTTDLAGLGPHQLEAEKFGYHLTREFAHTGPAWFAREIVIPEEWAGKDVELMLERVMWQSRIWVDGVEVGGAQDSLCVMHCHGLGKLAAGRHKLVMRIDNRMIHPIGDKSHAYGDQTQSTWNGVVGKLSLCVKNDNRIDLVRVFPAMDGKVKVEISGVAAQSGMRLICRMSGKDRKVTVDVVATADGHISSGVELHALGDVRTWSEFDPHLDAVDVELVDHAGKVWDTRQVKFGFREVARVGNQLRINGQPAFMRGNLECAVFPKTGHPPMDVESWKSIFKIYQKYGLNHARFHSWCPPEAAFIAADEVGIYLQIEAPIWMDGWMAVPNKRKEMDSVGRPQGLGKGDRGNDEFAQAEIRRILDVYGNHPSFVFFCIGNELGTTNFNVVGPWIRDAKAHDPRHLFAVSTARTITPFCDYNATHSVPGIGAVRQHLEFGTAWDYEASYARTTVPIMAHEVGQWPIYPDWQRELVKFTGPLKPYRLATMAAEASKSGVADQVPALHAASGAINRVLYRDEIESFMRTPSCRGFQLLGMQDFTGQGEAMVGWLDAFYQSKGTTDPPAFRRYCGPTVPLLKLPGYVFTQSDRPVIGAVLHHYGKEALVGKSLSWSLVKGDGKVVDSGVLAKRDYAVGSVMEAGKFTPNFSTCHVATSLDLVIRVDGCELSNQYKIWVFPESTQASSGGSSVVVTSDWSGEARKALAEGRRVVLMADQLGGRGAAKLANWLPLYWSRPFFPGQNRDTLGLIVDSKHAAMREFPTAGFGDWNWYRICAGGHGFDLTEVAPAALHPIVQPVTDFHANRKLGSVFEVKVGQGSLLVCGYNLSEARAKDFPEVAGLRKSLLDYAASAAFAPSATMETSLLDKLFDDPEVAQVALPDQFKHADIMVRAGGKATAQSGPWSRAVDAVLRQTEGVDYRVEADGYWRDPQGCAWHGRKMKVVVHPRAGVPGKFFVKFADWNHLGRTGKLEFEGHVRDLAAHGDGLWVEFPVIREDTNDGQLTLSAEVTSGPNLMISEIAFVPEE